MIASSPGPDALLRAVRSLPSAPQILARVGRMIADPNSDLANITDLLKRDPALTASVVRISNSVVYAPAEPCGSLEEAITRLGFAELYRVIAFAMAAQLCPQALPFYGQTGAQFRENALLTALVMEQ